MACRRLRGRPSEARLKFFDETFLQKSFDLALDLTRRAAQERKLGKQRSVFPGRRSASALNSRPSAWALKSRPWQLAIARAHQTASARPRPSAWALNSRPLAARYRSCSSRGQRTSAGVAPQAIRAKGRRLNAASVQAASARARRGLCMELSPSPHSIFYRARLRFL